jgi:hypothetical protein
MQKSSADLIQIYINDYAPQPTGVYSKYARVAQPFKNQLI